MKLRLKEDPREWLKFTVVIAFAVGVVAVILFRRKTISLEVAIGVGIGLGALPILCWARPHWFRGFYRGGMTASFRVGQVLSWIWLTLFFLFILTPLGLILRILGKDLLGLRRPRAIVPTYWKPTKTNHRFDRQF